MCAWVDGEYGISGVYLGVEAEIGAGGVKKIVERDLTDSELAGAERGGRGRARQAGRRRQPVTLGPGVRALECGRSLCCRTSMAYCQRSTRYWPSRRFRRLTG